MAQVPKNAGALIGQRLGEYELVALLALGGTAEIYLARHAGVAGFEKYVVVKCLHSHLADDSDFVKMFLDEARLGARLDHSNIVQTLELGSQDGQYYMAMEYLVGMSLSFVVRKAAERVPGGRLPVDLTLNLVSQACGGLHYAHNRRDADGNPLDMVHRDVSPQNLVVSFEGVLKVVDFGIAKAAVRDTRTQSGTIKGKFAYMSPEQCLAGDLDHRTDVFALGTITHELLTGKRLFKRESTYDTYHAILDCKVPPPSQVNTDLDSALDAVVLKALAKERDERYESAEAYADALVAVLHKHGKSVSHGSVARFFEEYFAAEIEEQGQRMRALIAGRKTQVDEHWGEDDVDVEVPAADGAADPDGPMATSELSIRDAALMLGNDNDEDDGGGATRIELNPLEQAQKTHGQLTGQVTKLPQPGAVKAPAAAGRGAGARAVPAPASAVQSRASGGSQPSSAPSSPPWPPSGPAPRPGRPPAGPAVPAPAPSPAKPPGPRMTKPLGSVMPSAVEAVSRSPNQSMQRATQDTPSPLEIADKAASSKKTLLATPSPFASRGAKPPAAAGPAAAPAPAAPGPASAAPGPASAAPGPPPAAPGAPPAAPGAPPAAAGPPPAAPVGQEASSASSDADSDIDDAATIAEVDNVPPHVAARLAELAGRVEDSAAKSTGIEESDSASNDADDIDDIDDEAADAETLVADDSKRAAVAALVAKMNAPKPAAGGEKFPQAADLRTQIAPVSEEPGQGGPPSVGSAFPNNADMRTQIAPVGAGPQSPARPPEGAGFHNAADMRTQIADSDAQDLARTIVPGPGSPPLPGMGAPPASGPGAPSMPGPGMPPGPGAGPGPSEQPYRGMLDEDTRLPYALPAQAHPMNTGTHQHLMARFEDPKPAKPPWLLAVLFVVAVGVGLGVTLLVAQFL